MENVPECPDGDPQGWKKTNWTMELKAVEKMLDADARNCMRFSVSLSAILTSSCVSLYSPRLGLSEICPQVHAREEARFRRASIHDP